MTGIKPPKNYEPKSANEFAAFDSAMTKLMSVSYQGIQADIKKDRVKKARKRRAKETSGRASSRDSGEAS